MVGDRAVFLPLVELARLDHRERILLAVDDTRLQRGVDLAELHADGIGAERLEQRDQRRGAGYAQLHAVEVGGVLDRLAAGGDLPEAEVPDALHRHETGLG